MRRFFTPVPGFVLVALFALAPLPAFAQDEPRAQSLDQLLRTVREGRNASSTENARREQEFASRKNEQQRLLNEARGRLRREEARSEQLEASFHTNEKALTEVEQELRERLGELGELFGVVRQVAGDTKGVLEGSIVSAQFPGRTKSLEALSNSKNLPSIEELENLWYVIQQEMTESGKVSRYDGQLVTPDGKSENASITRVGTFSAVSNGRFLKFSEGHLQLLPRQPAGRHLGTISGLESATTGNVAFALDPSRGAILNALIQTPTLAERVQQGRTIGYVIIGIAVIGLALAVFQWFRLFLTERAVLAQMKNSAADTGNPLGRVLKAYQDNTGVGVETLERKLDDAVLKEIPSLERFQPTIRVLSVVAPLLGLLGTVTGMIGTFQSIVLYGTGDPKLMAGGISEALVTTMLGLIAAIPLTLLHSFVQDRSRAVTQILDEQSAGIIAESAERGERAA